MHTHQYRILCISTHASICLFARISISLLFKSHTFFYLFSELHTRLYDSFPHNLRVFFFSNYLFLVSLFINSSVCLKIYRVSIGYFHPVFPCLLPYIIQNIIYNISHYITETIIYNHISHYIIQTIIYNISHYLTETVIHNHISLHSTQIIYNRISHYKTHNIIYNAYTFS